MWGAKWVNFSESYPLIFPNSPGDNHSIFFTSLTMRFINQQVYTTKSLSVILIYRPLLRLGITPAVTCQYFKLYHLAIQSKMYFAIILIVFISTKSMGSVAINHRSCFASRKMKIDIPKNHKNCLKNQSQVNHREYLNARKVKLISIA